MKVYFALEEFPVLQNPIVTIGNFDGVHLGHVHVLESLLNHENTSFESVVITFWPHPRQVLNPENDGIQFLTSIEEKIELLRNIGIKHLLILPFTLEMSEMTAEQFVHNILMTSVRAKKIIIGYDHRFGKGREGGLDYLKKNNNKYQFILEEIPKKEVDSIGISSSKIKLNISEGRITEANALLGRLYNVTGKVIEGKKLGRTIGFPTANIELTFNQKLIPKMGVYAVFVKLDTRTYKGMMNIGYRPTISGHGLSLEVHVFNLSEDLYGKTITVLFAEYLREEKKFKALEDLKAQLFVDMSNANEILN